MEVICPGNHNANNSGITASILKILVIKKHEDKRLTFYIPYFHKYVTGIVHGLDLDVDEGELIEIFSTPEMKVNKVIRMMRFNRETEQREPSESIYSYVIIKAEKVSTRTVL